jgi:excisionase family DNA binding protein
MNNSIWKSTVKTTTAPDDIQAIVDQAIQKAFERHGIKLVERKPEANTDILTVSEAAKMLRVSISQIHKMMTQGRLGFVVLSKGVRKRTIRIKREEIERIISK